jgi:hypothetical protein
MTYFQVVPGQVIGSDHMNTAINQGVVPFANAAARAAAIPAPAEGMITYLLDVKQNQQYIGGAWVIHSPDPWIRCHYSSNQGATHGGTLLIGTATLSSANAPFTASSTTITINQIGIYSVISHTRIVDASLAWFYLRPAGTAATATILHRAPSAGGSGPVSLSTWVKVTAPGQTLTLYTEMSATCTIEPIETLVSRISY